MRTSPSRLKTWKRRTEPSARLWMMRYAEGVASNAPNGAWRLFPASTPWTGPLAATSSAQRYFPIDQKPSTRSESWNKTSLGSAPHAEKGLCRNRWKVDRRRRLRPAHLVMARRGKNEPILFVAEYEDGTQEFFDVNRWTLRNGDAIAIVIAGEWQRRGRLKAGKIIRVHRAPPTA